MKYACRKYEPSGRKNTQQSTTHGNAPKGSGSYLRPITHIQHTHPQHLSTCTQTFTNHKRTATGCTQDTNVQHMHDETLTLPINEHLQLHASQYKQKIQHPSHPLHKYTTYLNTPRLKTLFLITAATQQTFPQTPTQTPQQTYKQTCAIYIHLLSLGI